MSNLETTIADTRVFMSTIQNLPNQLVIKSYGFSTLQVKIAYSHT